MLIRPVETQRDLIDILTLQKKNTKTDLNVNAMNEMGDTISSRKYVDSSIFTMDKKLF